jgi:hypothetical protein
MIILESSMLFLMFVHMRDYSVVLLVFGLARAYIVPCVSASLRPRERERERESL